MTMELILRLVWESVRFVNGGWESCAVITIAKNPTSKRTCIIMAIESGSGGKSETLERANSLELKRTEVATPASLLRHLFSQWVGIMQLARGCGCEILV
jgi:hypothetical protein